MPRYSFPESDSVRLRHMLDAAREAVGFAAGIDRYEFGGDRKLVLSLVKDIEIIGEAAGRVSEDVRRQLPEIPWQDVINMRNHLIHACFDIDVGVVWSTVMDDLPPLIQALEAALPTDSRGTTSG